MKQHYIKGICYVVYLGKESVASKIADNITGLLTSSFTTSYAVVGWMQGKFRGKARSYDLYSTMALYLLYGLIAVIVIVVG